MLQLEGLIKELKLDGILSELYAMSQRPNSYQAIIKPFDMSRLVYIDVNWRDLVSCRDQTDKRDT